MGFGIKDIKNILINTWAILQLVVVSSCALIIGAIVGIFFGVAICGYFVFDIVRWIATGDLKFKVTLGKK